MICTCCTMFTTGSLPSRRRAWARSWNPIILFWLEDPVAAELQDGFRLIRKHTTTPLAVGEVFNTIWDAEQLIREQLIDYLRMSVVHGGGLTAMKKAADFAALYHVQTGCHGASDMSPVCMAAALHLDIAINNFGVQEHMLHNAQTEETFPHAYVFRDGFMYPGDVAWSWSGYQGRCRRRFSVSTGVSAGQPQGRWNAVSLVSKLDLNRRGVCYV